MTRAIARQLLSTIGWTVRKTDGGDYRVNRRSAPEAHAYYTEDLTDAVQTALHTHYGNPRAVVRSDCQCPGCILED